MHLRSGAKIVPNLTPRANSTKATKRSQRKDSTPEPTPEPTPEKEERSRDPEVLEAMSQANASSPLLRLPQEIKNMIYHFVIDAHVIHIQRENQYHTKPGRLFRNSICQANQPNANNNDNMTPEERADLFHQMVVDMHENAWVIRHDRCQGPWDRYRRHHLIPDTWKVPSLLFLCRQAYAEARLIPYSKFTFSLNYPEDFEEWARTLSPAQVAAVRNLRLGDSQCSGSEWEPTIESMMGRLRGVKSIELYLGRPDLYDGDVKVTDDLTRIGQLDLGPATLVVREGFWQIVTFTGPPKDGC